MLSTGASQNNRLANTKERDFSIGLDNHGFRYFDPECGRYISRDPLGYPNGLNNYLSLNNNPINRFDPLGLGFGDWLGAILDQGLDNVREGVLFPFKSNPVYGAYRWYGKASDVYSGKKSIGRAMTEDIPGFSTVYAIDDARANWDEMTERQKNKAILGCTQQGVNDVAAVIMIGEAVRAPAPGSPKTAPTSTGTPRTTAPGAPSAASAVAEGGKPATPSSAPDTTATTTPEATPSYPLVKYDPVAALKQGVPPDQVCVPDSTVIVRGGQGAMTQPGETFSGSMGATLREAGQGIRHGSLRESSAGAITAQGGTVQVAPEPTNGMLNLRHVNVQEGGTQTTFSDVKPNPAPKSIRVGLDQKK